MAWRMTQRVHRSSKRCAGFESFTVARSLQCCGISATCRLVKRRAKALLGGCPHIRLPVDEQVCLGKMGWA